MVTVPAPAALVPIGDGLLAPGAASAAVQPATGMTIAQGALESSNVDLADASVESIEARTSSAAAAAAFRAQDAMLAALLGL